MMSIQHFCTLAAGWVAGVYIVSGKETGEDPRGNISGNDSLRDALRAHLLTSLHQNSGNSEQHMTTVDQPAIIGYTNVPGCANALIW